MATHDEVVQAASFLLMKEMLDFAERKGIKQFNVASRVGNAPVWTQIAPYLKMRGYKTCLSHEHDDMLVVKAA